MGAPFTPPLSPPRRAEVLALVIQRIIRTGTSPTSGEIASALSVSRQRAQQLIDQLVREGVLEKTPGSPRSLRIRDLKHCRHVIVETLRGLGITASEPMGDLLPPLSPVQLPVLPPFEHLPDPD
ncbi:MarR family transcriptional regulator [Sphingomonas aerophila]|uniref:SOS-response transcriptional repressor LexA n=1 Tax=Sphingomonas aerophila TaxID=1344948 RepID=A0A7W9EW70_9SPHN|nr:SOS-response transcriptional repressor LexA [Sphingomonas aerophila]